jgi:hypothetical protein
MNLSGTLDRWARREQRRTERENAAELAVRGQPRSKIAWGSLIFCAIVAALPWRLWIVWVAVSAIVGLLRRWYDRRSFRTGP